MEAQENYNQVGGLKLFSRFLCKATESCILGDQGVTEDICRNSLALTPLVSTKLMSLGSRETF